MPKERRMKIAICASMVFAEKMVEVKGQLEEIGHVVFISQFAEGYLGKAEKEKEKLAVHDKNEHDAIRKFWEIIKKSDAILVLNYDRKGITNYIGGNTLMEIGFAHVLDQTDFFDESDSGYRILSMLKLKLSGRWFLSHDLNKI